MAINNSVDSGHVLGGDQNTGVQGAEQLVPKTVFDTMDQRLGQVGQLVGHPVTRVDAMETNTNRYGVIDGE